MRPALDWELSMLIRKIHLAQGATSNSPSPIFATWCWLRVVRAREALIVHCDRETLPPRWSPGHSHALDLKSLSRVTGVVAKQGYCATIPVVAALHSKSCLSHTTLPRLLPWKTDSCHRCVETQNPTAHSRRKKTLAIKAGPLIIRYLMMAIHTFTWWFPLTNIG